MSFVSPLFRGLLLLGCCFLIPWHCTWAFGWPVSLSSVSIESCLSWEAAAFHVLGHCHITSQAVGVWSQYGIAPSTTYTS